MKKKLVTGALLCAFGAVAVTGGTLAYFTDDDAATNEFTVGNVTIDLVEPNWDASGSGDAPEVYPGEALAKDPMVKNIGANPCFIRVSVEGLDCLKPAGDIIYRTNYTDGILGEGWVKHTDGYYYYTNIVEAGKATTKLFEQIVIPTDLQNGDGKTPFNVVVKAYAVQAQGANGYNWAGVKAMQGNVGEIAKWFGTSQDSTWPVAMD